MSPIRSRCSSCKSPFSTSATRLSEGVTLISSSLLMYALFSIRQQRSCPRYSGNHIRKGANGTRASNLAQRRSTRHQAGIAEQAGCFEQGQPDHAAVAAVKVRDPGGRLPLNRVPASLVQRLAARRVSMYPFFREYRESNLRNT